MNKFLGCWSNKNDIANEFRIDSKELKGARIVVAWYGQGDYEGSAFVLYRQNGKLYEVNGGHCSCMGLEDQWEPEETTVEALKHRIEHGYMFSDYYTDGGAAKEALQQYCSKRKS